MITNFYYSILLVEIIHNKTFPFLNPNGEHNKPSFSYLIFKKKKKDIYNVNIFILLK